MALDTNSALQATVLRWLARPADTAISSDVPDMITLFEEEARDRLRTRFNEIDTTITTTSGLATVALPTMFEGARELVLQGSPNQVLTYVTPEQMDETWPDSASHDQPLVFTIIGLNFRFAPIPDSAYTIRLVYMQGIPALSGAGGTNWLLANYPSLYLWGTLAMAEAFIGHDERIALWVAAKEAAFDRLLLADRKVRWSGQTLQIKTDVGNP